MQLITTVRISLNREHSVQQPPHACGVIGCAYLCTRSCARRAAHAVHIKCVYDMQLIHGVPGIDGRTARADCAPGWAGANRRPELSLEHCPAT